MIAALLKMTEWYLRNCPFRFQENTHFRLIVIGRASLPEQFPGRVNHSGPLVWRRASRRGRGGYGLSKTWYSGPSPEKVVGWACVALGRHLRRRRVTYIPRGASNGGAPVYITKPSSAAARKSWTMPARVHAIRYRRFRRSREEEGPEEKRGERIE